MKQVEVTIMGQSYILACPDDGEASLRQAVASVDQEMCAIRDAGRIKARDRIAVLAALNLAYRLAEVPATRAAPAAAAASADTIPSAGAGTEPSVDVSGLVDRIDAALAREGRLL